MARERMARQDRYDQLVGLAWTIVRDNGTDDLTLGRLAEAAGVTKPVVYSHFASRSSLLVALFEEYDERQTAELDRAIAAAPSSVRARAHAVAESYVDCVVGQGPELAGVTAALEGTPELADVKRRSDLAYVEKMRTILAGVRGGRVVSDPAMTAILGSAEALSAAAASGDMRRDVAVDELTEVIEAAVARGSTSRRRPG